MLRKPLLSSILLLAAVVSARDIERECRKEGQIAFTFDQGPSKYTGILLSILKKENVKATFHMVPDYLDNPVISANLRRAATDGHLIGLFIKESIEEDAIKGYLQNASKVMKQYTNYEPRFLRFPNPGPSSKMLKIVTSLGYTVTTYNMDSLDYDAIGEHTDKDGKGTVFNNVKEVLDQIIPPTLGSFICVQRDLIQASVLQTEAILKYSSKLGYKAVRLDQCLGSGGRSDDGSNDDKGKFSGYDSNFKGKSEDQSNATTTDPLSLAALFIWMGFLIFF